MKKILALAAALGLVTLLATCSLFGSKTSIDQCIANFMGDINNTDRSNVYTTLDSSSGQYSQAKTPSFWDSHFPTVDAGSYALSNKNTSGNPATATITSNTYYGSSGSPIVFGMSTDSSGNAVIHSITIASTTIFD
jgi:hypothetical protein